MPEVEPGVVAFAMAAMFDMLAPGLREILHVLTC